MVNGYMKMVEKKYRLIIYTLIFLYLVFNTILPLSASNLSDSHYNTDIIMINQNQDIQEILNSAPINATIVFQTGVYSQSFQITKPLIIRGMGKNNTFFDIKTKPNNPAITISSPFVTFSDICITNSASGLYTTALRVDASHVLISNCLFQHTPIGIAVWNNNTQIINSSFYNCSDEGILLISTSISNAENNFIYNCVFSSNCDGIELQHSSHNTISSCVFKENYHAGVDAICDNNNNNIITNCTFLNNRNFDIYFSSSKYNIISECQIENEQKTVVFNPSFESNKISIKSLLPQMEETSSELNIKSEDHPYKISQLIHSICSQRYEFMRNLLEEIIQIVQKLTL